MKKNHRIMKAMFVCIALSVFSLAMVYQGSAQTVQDNYLLRVEVQAEHGEQVKISFPLSLIETVYSVMPKDIHRICKDLELSPQIILQELKAIEGQDLVRVEGKDKVRVWMEAVTADTQKELGFVRVYVKEPREDGHEVNVCVPRGLVQLTGKVIKSLGLVDKYVELPEEITNLKVDETNDN